MITTIEDRVAKLERSNRRLRLILLGGIAIGAVGVGLGMNQANKVPDVIQAKSIEVVDDTGAVLVELSSTRQDGATEVAGTLTTFKSDGNRLVWISNNAQGNGNISVYTEDAREMVRLGTFFHGTRRFDKEDQDIRVGHALIELGLNETGTGALAVYDDDGNELVTLTSTEEGLGAFGTFEPNGAALLIALPGKEIGGRLIAFQGAGNVIGVWPDTPED